ncbi:uncharacterized protein LOC126901350 isoform X1 [Daktulosphaira vitifoliae]|uniref:uncharacterized protein LOC126901350 isoform X1 n=1 Tax=Daktulosphaira vitifoliae TaxID=58002 RepID=UPI0021AAF9A7|nr:uncharacterized protein LOC126901350 isoform X1 [Daktulosphaira vitifoliae]
MVGAYYSWIIRISYLYSNYNKVLSVVPVRLRWRLLLVIAIRSIAQIVAASGKVTKFSILSYPRCVDSAVMLVFFSRCLPSLTVRHSSEMVLLSNLDSTRSYQGTIVVICSMLCITHLTIINEKCIICILNNS